MTLFPDSPLDVQVELLLNNIWVNVSQYLDHGPVTISRGHPDESTTVSASKVAYTLSNTSAQFATRNPTSPYYPWLVRNTQTRVSIPSDQPYLRLEADQASYASCPAIAITTDLDVRADILLTGRGLSVIAGSWQTGGPFGWTLNLDAGGIPHLSWSTTGSDSPGAAATASLPLGRITVRATLQLSTGNVTYYTAAGGNADTGPWTQLGAVVNTTGATSLHAPLVALCAGGHAGTASGMYGRVYEVEVRNGIGGTVVAHPVFSSQAAGTTSFTDGQGNTWTLGGTSELSARDYRAYVEAAEFPQVIPPVDSGGATTKPVTVPVVGGGLLRRLAQRNNSVNSAMWRAWVKGGASLASYHPCEDTAGAQSLASGIGGPPAQFSGALQLASNSDFTCSAPLPVLAGTVIVGQVPAYAPGWTGNQVSWLQEIPSGGEFNTAEIFRFATTGTISQCVVTYGTGGSMAVTGYNTAGTQLFTSGPIAFAANGELLLMWVSLQNDGSGNVNWSLNAITPDAALIYSTSGTLSSASTGAVTSWTMDGGGQLLQTVAGHVAVQAAAGSLTALGGPLNAWQGEPAGSRFQRLCLEENIPFRAGGNLAATVAMGVQQQATLTTLLQDTADASRSVWCELRQQLGFGLIPPGGLYNQAAQVAVTYAQDNLNPFSSPPTEDDQVTRNDETISQASGGSSARVFAAPGQAIPGGRLSTLAPPSGTGTYDDSQSYNIQNIADLANVAGWMVRLGTTDMPRFPGIVLDLSNRALASLFWQILALDIGQLTTIASPPAELGPDTIGQLAQQLDEVLWSDQLTITIAGIPSVAYQVARDGGVARHADTAGSALSSALPAPLEVAIPAPGPVAGWTAFGAAISSVASPAASPVPQWVTWVSAGTAFGNVQAPAVAVSASTTYTVSGLLFCASAYTVRCGLGCFAGGTNLGDVVTSVTIPAGVVTPFSVSVATPAGTTTALPEFQVAAPTSGDTVWVTALSIWAGSVSVATTAGPLWTTSAADFPFDIVIAGERMTVIAVSGSSSPQAFSVARGVNGVVKAQAAGAPIAVWHTPVAAL